MATMTEHDFAFDSRSGPGIGNVHFANSMALPSYLGDFLDDAVMTELLFAQQDYPGIDCSERQDTLDPDVLLRKSDRTKFSDDVPSIVAEDKSCGSNDLEMKEASPDDGQSSPKGANGPDSSNRSKKRTSSTRCHPKKRAGTGGGRKRREQDLEKNRVAANKCRQKKKMGMAKLDDRCRDLAARNGFLREEVNNLGSTVLDLKELAFQHAECGYALIEEYIRAEAHKTQAWTRSRGQEVLSMEESPLQNQRQSGTPPTFDFPNTDPGGARHEDSAVAAGSASV